MRAALRVSGVVKCSFPGRGRAPRALPNPASPPRARASSPSSTSTSGPRPEPTACLASRRAHHLIPPASVPWPCAPPAASPVPLPLAPALSPRPASSPPSPRRPLPPVRPSPQRRTRFFVCVPPLTSPSPPASSMSRASFAPRCAPPPCPRAHRLPPRAGDLCVSVPLKPPRASGPAVALSSPCPSFHGMSARCAPPPRPRPAQSVRALAIPGHPGLLRPSLRSRHLAPSP